MAALLAVALPLAGAAAEGQGAEWRLQVVDSGGGGSYSSMRVDTNGNVHVSYIDEVQNQVKYGFWDHKLDKWFTTVLDRSAGFSSMVLDKKQQPHISYLDYGTGKLKYARWNGGAWEKQTIQINAKNISFYTSIALDDKGNPRISYYEYWGTGDDYRLQLRNVVWNGKFWEVRTIDTVPGSGKFNSMTSDSAGVPQIAYANVKAENAGLRYAIWNGRAWDIQVLEGVKSPYPVHSVSLAIAQSGVPHIAYTDVTLKLVKYATLLKKQWYLETIDSLVEEAYPDRHGIALDDHSEPYISYFDAGSGLLKLAHREGGKWVTEVVDQNFAGFTSSLEIARGKIWLTYKDEGGQLKFAYRSLIPAGEVELKPTALPSSAREKE
jgi:hypothetical protein